MSKPTAKNFYLVDDTNFERLGRPGYGDWLYHNPEWGQSFWSYLRAHPGAENSSITNKVLVLQPLGDFNTEEETVLEASAEFCMAFFQTDVRIDQTTELPSKWSRERATGRQYKTPQLLLKVLKPKLPEDAFCYLGVTTKDLYNRDDWNFVYGSALTGGQVGVFSLARYFPEFHNREREPDSKQLIIRRSCAVLAHEAAHSLGLEHCIYYGCLMQGSNHLAELDDKPLFLCPICLAKLKYSLKCDLDVRYQDLQSFFEKHQLKNEVQWIERRTQHQEQIVKMTSQPENQAIAPKLSP